MVRNWVTQFGFDAGTRAGDERISPADRGKFIDQIGTYFGWTPPPTMNWAVEVTKDDADQYIMVFLRYATDAETERMLGTNYEKLKTVTDTIPPDAEQLSLSLVPPIDDNQLSLPFDE